MATPPNGRDGLRTLILILLVPVLVASSGCAWGGYAGEIGGRPYTDRIVLSADGRQAAYVWTDRCWSLILFPPPMLIFPPLIPVGSLAAAKTEWLGWCTPDGTNHLVRIDARTRVFGGFGNSRSIRGIAFSPDGRHLAAVLRDRIAIVDTGTGEVRQLTCPRGEFTSARWFDNTQLAYATTSRTDEPGVLVRSVYRQAIDKGKPIRVFSRTSRHQDYAAFRESWAPDGRTALLSEGLDLWRLDIASGAIALLDRVTTYPEKQRDPLSTTSGMFDPPPIPFKTEAYGGVMEVNWHMHWRPDGKEVSVLAIGPTWAKLLLAGVFDCQSWRFADRTTAFYRDVGDRWVQPISWTPDGLLLVRASKSGTWSISLVRHDPWRVIDVSERYGKELPHNTNGFAVVQHLMPGWLAIGPGKKDPMMYAVAYDGKRQRPVTKYPFKISGNGRRLAEVIRKGKITVRTLDLPGK